MNAASDSSIVTIERYHGNRERGQIHEVRAELVRELPARPRAGTDSRYDV